MEFEQAQLRVTWPVCVKRTQIKVVKNKGLEWMTASTEVYFCSHAKLIEVSLAGSCQHMRGHFKSGLTKR